MPEERIAAIEVEVRDLKEHISNVIEQQSALDKIVTKLVYKMNSHLDEEKQTEMTLQKISSNIDGISIRLAAGPMERHREVKELVDPLWSIIRKHDSRFNECGATIKEELRKEAKSHLVLVWVAVLAMTGMGLYILEDAKEDVMKQQEHNLDTIESFHGTGE